MYTFEYRVFASSSFDTNLFSGLPSTLPYDGVVVTSDFVSTSYDDTLDETNMLPADAVL